MNDTDRQIVSGPYAASTLGIDDSAPWVVGDIPVLTGLAENLYTWLGTLMNGLIGSKSRLDGIQAQGMPRESVAMDSWRRDSVLNSRPALNASPALNRDVIAQSGQRYVDYIDSVELGGSILGEVLGNYIDGDVFIAPTLPIALPSGTILDGITEVIL